MSPLALISVSDKTNIITLAQILVNKFSYTILSSGGTAQYLIDNGIPVKKVSEFTNFPEILEGRVKTLHPKIHGGILAKRSSQKHLKDMQANKIEPIDIVVVNLYPFQQKIAANCSWEEGIENIDIGGPSMIRSAAKNHNDVSILVNHEQYEEFIQLLSQGNIDQAYKTKLAYEAFQHTAIYDAAISDWISKEKNLNSRFHFDPYPLAKQLRYGENPHQEAKWYGSRERGWNAANQLQGKELSYNNLLDLDSALSTVLEFGYGNNSESRVFPSAAVILKHNNPCGAAIGNSIEDAFQKALKCDPVSAFGGIVAFNKNVNSETAHLLCNIFLECIVAPSFDKDAQEILRTKKNLRLLQLNKEVLDSEKKIMYKSIMGGVLVQDKDNKNYNSDEWEIVTKSIPDEEEMQDLKFSWKICKHVKSNAIVIAKEKTTLAIGAGQMNRVGAAKIALEASKDLCKGGVLASDGFFPFADTVELAGKYGIKAIVQPGGSLRDKESIEMCNKKNISMIFTNQRHFLH